MNKKKESTRQYCSDVKIFHRIVRYLSLNENSLKVFHTIKYRLIERAGDQLFCTKIKHRHCHSNKKYDLYFKTSSNTVIVF